MKKILVLLAILISGIAFSQQEYRIYKIKFGPKNNYTNDYDTQENRVNMRMILDNSVVKIFDDARSVYITKNYRVIKEDSQGSIAKWDAVDERGRNVGIFMTFNKETNESSLAVMYNDFMFQYFFVE